MAHPFVRMIARFCRRHGRKGPRVETWIEISGEWRPI